MTPNHLLPNKAAHRARTLIFLFTVTLSMSAQWTAQEEQEGGIPAYNAGLPPKGTKLPAIMTKADLWGADAQYPYQTHAYDLAAKIPAVLHQQPCYCYCDRMGHNLPAAPEGQDRKPNSRRHHQRRVEADRPAIGCNDQLVFSTEYLYREMPS
jgi:hypothetical protein